MSLQKTDSKHKFSVLTLNCWGLPGWVAVLKQERMEAIAKALLTVSYDIVCLQEVWVYDDYNYIKSEVSVVLPHSHYFYSGVRGSGLCIFSKWPIEEVMFFRWPVNGYMHMIHHGDWFGGKGVGFCQINMNGIMVNVYNTHLHAKYNNEEDSYLAHRVVQAYDTSTLIRTTCSNADVCILAGDINTKPGELCYRIIQLLAELKDAFDCENNEGKGGTNDCFRNSFANKKKIEGNPEGDRIDYILYKPANKVKTDVLLYQLPFAERIPGQIFSYSDHEAVAATFEVTLNHLAKPSPPRRSSICFEDIKKTLYEALLVCDKAVLNVKVSSLYYWFYTISIFLCCVLCVQIYPFTAVTYIIVVFLTIIFCFTIMMATLWYYLEINALIGAISRMKVSMSAREIQIDRWTNQTAKPHSL